jgi:hypothetical protein
MYWELKQGESLQHVIWHVALTHYITIQPINTII